MSTVETSTTIRFLGSRWMYLAAGALALAAVPAALDLIAPHVEGLPSGLATGIVVAAVSAGITFATLRSGIALPDSLPGTRAFWPIVILIVINFVFPGTIAGLLNHQAAWGITGLALGWAIVTGVSPRGTLPAWLLAFLGIEVVLQVGATGTTRPVLELGFTGIGLWASWWVACTLQRRGGLTSFLTVVIFAFWGSLAVAAAVKASGVPIGSFTPGQMMLPWESELGGNWVGWGFVSTQLGTMVVAVVVVYHYAAWRFGETCRRLHLILLIGSVAIFATGYGRVPQVGAVIAFAAALACSRSRLRFGVMAAIAVIGATTLIGGGKLIDLRTDTGTSWTSGHVRIWSQHLGMMALHPWAGAGFSPSPADTEAAASLQILKPSDSLEDSMLANRGSRGEGGWTSLLATSGGIGGGIIIGLILRAMTVIVRSNGPGSRQIRDAVVMRAVLLAAPVWYVTDLSVAGTHNIGDYVVLQLTMCALVQTLSGSTSGIAEPPSAMIQEPVTAGTTSARVA